MLNFNFYSPTMFVFGKGEENNVGSYVKKFGGTRVLLHFGGGSAVRSGLIGRVTASLDKEGISYVTLSGVQPNPRSGLVYEGIELCRKEKVDFILAVGGGSSIDSAKAIAAGALYDGDFWDFYSEETGKVAIQRALPVGTILTIAAAGSEASGDTVITQEKGMYKRGAGSDVLRPKFSIMNPELTMTLPPYQTACGAVDIMVHVLERYFTNTPDVEITDRMCEGILLTMLNEVPKVMENPHDYEARANIMWAGTVAHNNICGVGREQDWASHDIEHELSALYDCAHGAGLAVIFPAWMEYVSQHHEMSRFAQLAVRVLGCQMDFAHPENTVKAGIAALRRFWSSIGMPTSFAELGAKEEDIPAMVKNLRLDKRAVGHFLPMTEESCAAIYKLACR